MRKYCIYEIRNVIDNKYYVGRTGNVEARWRAHKRDAKIKECLLYRAMRFHGIENFEFTVVKYVETLQDVKQEEILRIAFRQSTDRRYGYNITPGGEDHEAVLAEIWRKRRERKAIDPEGAFAWWSAIRKEVADKIPYEVHRKRALRGQQHMTKEMWQEHWAAVRANITSEEWSRIQTEKWAKIPKERRFEIASKREAAMAPGHRAALTRAQMARRTPEERAQFAAKRAATYAEKTPEERVAIIERMKATKASKTPEEKAAIAAKRAATIAAKRAA